MAVLPEGVGLDLSLQKVEQPTKTFLIDWPTKKIVGVDDSLAAIRQAVEIILRCERYHWLIFTSNFGSELEDLIGEEYDYITSDLPRRIEDALSMDARIRAADNFVFNRLGDSIVCKFDIVTILGTFSEKITL